MKKTIAYAGLFLLLASLITGCVSTPTPEPEAPTKPAEPATEPVDEALTALRDKMEALRADCLKYRLDQFMKDDWSAAEGVRQTGLDAYGKKNDVAKASFEDAIARYEKIRSEGFALAVSEFEQNLARVRQEAIDAGADSYYPEQFGAADATVDEAKALRDSGDLSGCYDKAQLALIRYQILIEGMKAVALRQKIDKYDFSQYAPEEYLNGETKYGEAAEAYGSSDPVALESMKAAVVSYRKVANAGFRAFAEKEVAQANEAKKLCDSIKASRSVKADFDAAQDKYDHAAGAGARDEWENAWNGYVEARDGFSLAYQKALLKKNAADNAISAAKARQASSAELASKADKLAPLPENAEGYSDEPYVIEGADQSSEPATVEPSAEPAATEPAVEPTAEPAAESAATEPAVEPTAEPADAQPATEDE